MRVTKYTHSCVRVEVPGGGTLVIDPGIWTEPEALDGADAVLVTHEHIDHIDGAALAGRGLPIHAPVTAGIPGLAVVGLVPGQEFSAAGATIRAVGGRHALIYGSQPDCANLGYVLDDDLYHPGDALHLPESPVRTLLVPMQASWLKTAEAIDFLRAVQPEPGSARPEILDQTTCVPTDSSSRRETSATSAIALSNASSLRREGTRYPLTFRTN